jgi:D-alanyl-D-alanine carboxypeptidase
VKTLDDHLDEVLQTGVPGVVAFTATPWVTWQGGAGLADVETRTELTPDHRFPIASVTKIFVATIVLQLVGEGVLALDGNIGGIADGVTVRQLLNHTSGIPNYYGDFDSLLDPYRKNRAYRPKLTPHDALAVAISKPRLFPPGAGWSYTESNYIMLGRIIEVTTGSTLRDELKRRITEPLGLGATELPGLDGPPIDLAHGYLPPGNPLLPELGPGLVDVTDIDLFTWGGGGMVSTAREVARFLQALLAGELLPPRLRVEMLSTVSSDWDESDGYGLGIEEVTSMQGQRASPCGSAWGHLGFAFGHTTIALSSRSGDRQVVIMANSFVISDETWRALSQLTWACYCGS